MAIDRHTDGDVVVQTVPLGFQWPTADPYLFCVHHLDHYPAGNGDFGPAASLAGNLAMAKPTKMMISAQRNARTAIHSAVRSCSSAMKPALVL